jgi:hypothetical protein
MKNDINTAEHLTERSRRRDLMAPDDDDACSMPMTTE